MEAFDEFVEIGMFVLLARVQLVDGLTTADVTDALKTIVANATESISEMGITEEDAEGYVDLVTSVIISALRALDDAGVDSADIDSLFAAVISAAVGPLKDEFDDFDSFLGALEAELELSLEAEEEFDDLEIGGSDFEVRSFLDTAEAEEFDAKNY